MTKIPNHRRVFVLEIGSFEFVSDFDIRISDFRNILEELGRPESWERYEG